MPTLAVGMLKTRENRHMPTASVGMAPVPRSFRNRDYFVSVAESGEWQGFRNRGDFGPTTP